MEKMVGIAQAHTQELGKAGAWEPQEAGQLFELLGMGALRYFFVGRILRLIFRCGKQR